MDKIFGKWWIADDNIKAEKYFGELKFDETKPGELYIYNKLNELSDRFLEYLGKNKGYTIQGETNHENISCLNCHTHNTYILVCEDNGKGKYTSVMNPD